MLKVFRWIVEMVDDQVLTYAMIGMLLHASINVLENILVNNIGKYFSYSIHFVTDPVWKNTLPYTRTMGIILWRRRYFTRTQFYTEFWSLFCLPVPLVSCIQSCNSRYNQLKLISIVKEQRNPFKNTQFTSIDRNVKSKYRYVKFRKSIPK